MLPQLTTPQKEQQQHEVHADSLVRNGPPPMNTMQSSTPSSKPVNSSLSTSNSLATTLHGAQHVHHRLRLGCDDVSVGEGSQQSLTSVSALMHSGRVTAIVGCNNISTSPLSALLHVLAGREALQASGHVLLNGTPASAPSYQARCAFLSEEYIVAFDELSVRENLEYVAAMRLTTGLQHDSCDEVDEVMNQLRLTGEQHTKLAHCSLYVRRRVALGVELLLHDPLVVLLSDPLRGLATQEAQQYLDILHHIASAHSTSSNVQCTAATGLQGVTDSNTTASATLTTQPLVLRERVVVLTMVQPRWALLQYVDDVMLLVHTRCVYSGSLDGLLAQALRPTNLLATENDNSNAEGHEATSDTRCVLCGNDEYNASAEHDVKEVQRSSDTIQQTRETPARATVSLIAAEQQRMEKLLRSLYDTATSTNGEEQLATRFGQAEHTRRAITRFLHECATGSCTLNEGNASERCNTSKCVVRQLYYMSYYDLLRVRSSVSGLLIVFYLLLLVGLACLLALLYHYIDNEDTPLDMNSVDKGQSAMQSRVGLLFCVVGGTMLHAILSQQTIREYYHNYQHRQRAQGYCGVGTFLLYTTLSCALVRLVFITCLFGLTWLILFFCYQDIPAYTSLLSLALIVGLTSLASYFVVFFICALLDALHRPALATYILLVTFTVNVLLAGLVLNLPTLPHVIRFMSFCTVLRLSYESAILTQFVDHSFGCHTNHYIDALQLSALSSSIDGSSSSSTNSMCFTGLEYAHFMGFNEQRCWTNIGLLAALIASCVVGCFFAITFYRPRPHKYTVKE